MGGNDKFSFVYNCLFFGNSCNSSRVLGTRFIIRLEFSTKHKVKMI